MSPRFDPDGFRCVGGMTFQAASLLKSPLMEMPVASKRSFIISGMMSGNNMDILQLYNPAEQFWELPLK